VVLGRLRLAEAIPVATAAAAGGGLVLSEGRQDGADCAGVVVRKPAARRPSAGRSGGVARPVVSDFRE
jgi:hypothetical protein